MYINLFIFGVFAVLIFADNKYVDMIGYTFMFLYGGFFYLKSKVKLVFTNRIKRTLILNLLLMPLLIIENKIFIMFFIMFFEFVSIITFLISKKIENKINNSYLKKAKFKLEKYNGLKIAITGSYGKTSTKYYIGKILEKYKSTLFTKKSYNTMLGISRIVNEEELSKYDYFITEMGASHLGDIEELMLFVRPKMTILTSIGYMHLDTFGTIANIIEEKCKIADMLDENQITIANFENEFIRNHDFKNRIISYGFNYGEYQAKNIIQDKFTEFDVFLNNEFFYHYKTKLVGVFNVLNLLATIICLNQFGLDRDVIYEEILQIENVKNRLEITKKGKNIILDDSFNSNLEGAKNALNEMKKYPGIKILITPGFVEMKDVMNSANEEYAQKIKEVVDKVFLVGKNETKNLYNKLINLNVDTYVFNSFKEAYNAYSDISTKIQSVLLIENDLPDLYKKGF